MHGELAAILAADLPGQDDAAKLAEILYRDCYARSILDSTRVGNGDTPNQDLTSILVAANRSRPVWDEGWRIDQILDEGRILATKGAAVRSFLPGEYLTHRGLGFGPEAEKKVSIFLPEGSADTQAGFYHVFGETAADFEDDQRPLRFYWNVSVEGAPHVTEALSGELNRFQIPFHFKCGSQSAHYPRRDAAVLYLQRRYYAIAALLMERVHARLGPWLSPGTPLFTRRFADGLGFAEDPGESFGKHRCTILAEAMAASRGQPVEERLQEVRHQFERRGLSLDRPWLNAGSRDSYEFPFPAA